MSRSKDPTEDIQPSSSGEKTEAKAPPSGPSASMESTGTSTPISRTPSPDMLSSASAASTTVPTTLTAPRITERIRQHAMLVKIALKILLNAGLIKRYEVRSNDLTTVLRIRYEFDLSLWTDDLELK